LNGAAVLRAALDFVALPAAQRGFITNLDAILATAMPELERVAARRAFARLLAPDAQTPALDEQHYFAWVTREFAAAATVYLRAQKDKKAPHLDEGFGAAVLAAQRERAESAAETVEQRLGPYLLSRADQIDVPGLVRLMFSTSILYTRPLTREELCDLNVVNRDCAS
ncbi:hypothetical protein CLD22_30455, partial [Rubrivivax gelatinosus]|nr:hypothetical protein [Rubrivivax gelatinosus]